GLRACCGHLSALRSRVIYGAPVSLGNLTQSLKKNLQNRPFQRMKAAFLNHRGVIKVSGEDARNFLNGLVTTDVTLLRPGLGRFGALLTPQGKIIVDFLVTEAPDGHGGGFLIDAPRPPAKALS